MYTATAYYILAPDYCIVAPKYNFSTSYCCEAQAYYNSEADEYDTEHILLPQVISIILIVVLLHAVLNHFFFCLVVNSFALYLLSR